MSASLVLMSVWSGAVAIGAAPLVEPSDPTYWQDIRPVFQQHCTICHAQKNIEKKDVGGGLALTSFDAVTKNPKQPVVVPGKSPESKLFELLVTKDQDKRMPKDDDPLPEEQIELIRKWIDGGAKEGERPTAKTDEPAAPAAPRRPASLVRTLDVVLPSTATLPADVAKSLALAPANPGKLELAMKIGPLPPVTALAYSPDGKLLAVGSYGALAVWDLAAAELSRSLEFLGAVHCVAFSPDGSRLAAAGGLPARSGQVTIYDPATWQVVATLGEHTDVVYNVAFSPDGKTLATASFDKTAKMWNLENLKSRETLKGHSDFVYDVAFTPDGKHLLSSSKDRSIKVYSTQTWQSVRTLSGHNEDVLTIAVSGDSYNVVSAGKEPQLKWWIIENGQNNRNQSGHSGAVNELIFSSDGKRIASVGQDRNVRIWDGSNGSLLRSIAGATDALYSVALSPDARFVAAGSRDGLLRIWETETGRLLATLIAPPSPDPAQPQWLAATPEGYYHASDELAGIAEWRTGGQTVAGDILNTTLRQPEQVRRGLRGEAVEAVQFPTAN